MKTFLETLNEGSVTVNNMVFNLIVSNDQKGLYVQCIPNAATLDVDEKKQVDVLLRKLNSYKICQIPGLFSYDANHQAAGRIFRLNNDIFTDYIIKNF